MFTPAIMLLLYIALGVCLTALVALVLWKHVLRPWLTAVPGRVAVPGREPVASEFHRSVTTGTPVAAQRTTWDNRRLFEPILDENADIPRVDADAVPVTNPDDYTLGRATPIVAELLPESDESRAKWKRDLRAAGYLSPRAWQNFAATRYLLIIVPMLVLGLLLLVVPPRLELVVLGLLLIVPLLGWALPALIVRGKVAERRAEIERGLPDLIDMLNMCVSQGLTVLASLKRIRPHLVNAYPALTTELGIVIHQAELGNLRQALENWADRVDSAEVHSLVNLLTQTDRMGTSVSEALAQHSDGVRETLRQRADEKANRASFQLLFPTVLCLMPAVYLILMGPAVIQLTGFFGGEGRTLMQDSRAALQQIDTVQQDSGL